MATFLDLSEAKQTRLFPAPAPTPAKTSKRTLDAGSIPGLSGFSSGTGGFAAAKFNRLTADFLAQSRSADQDLFGDNIRLRARGRKIAIDNPFGRKFLQMVAQNIVGAQGILMQAKVKGTNGKETAESKRANLRIEEEWNNWCEVGQCTADGKFSFVECQQLAIKNVAREGENLAKVVYGRAFNAAGMALQLLDNDQLDDHMMMGTNDPANPGGSVRMGVEVNQYQRPLAYWLWDGHPYDIIGGNRDRKRIPAELVIHTYVAERPVQTRGYTWYSASILSMKMYDGYNEAELVAARASAAKFFSIESDVADGFDDDDEDAEGDDLNADGTQLMTANSGEGMQLDPGQRLNFIDPKHPTQAFRDFSRTAIRNIATGLLVSYPSLGNDLEGVNFSSIRAGLLDERDCWRVLQRWFIDHFCKQVFQAWLKVAKLTVLSDVALSPAQWRQIGWKSRGWEWVDPLKDAQATVLRLQNGFSTYADELGNLGRDFEETMTERAKEADFIKALKLVLGTDIHGIDDAATDPAPAADGKKPAGQQDGGS